jgi:hypothetical protein
MYDSTGKILRLHPGTVWDMRSAGPPRTQCTYDAQGLLITTGTGIGTVDEEEILVDTILWTSLQLTKLSGLKVED